MSSPSARQRFGYEQHERPGQRHVEAIYSESAARLGAGSLSQRFRRDSDFGQAFAQRSKWIICAMCCLRDGAERGLIQPAAHDFTIRITQKLRLALLIDDLDFGAGGGADTNREHNDMLLGEIFGHFDPALFEILTIGDHDQEFLSFRFLECVDSFIQRAANVSARNGNGLVIDDRQCFLKSPIIERQRALQKSLARESDQSDASSSPALHKIHNRQLGALEAAGRDIGRQHAARTIQHEYYILTISPSGIGFFAPLGSCQRQTNRANHNDEQRIFCGTTQGAMGAAQVRQEMLRSQLRKLTVSSPGRISLQSEQQQRPQHRQPKPARFGEMWMGEAHGTLRNLVFARSNSIASKPAAASRGHWNNGR